MDKNIGNIDYLARLTSKPLSMLLQFIYCIYIYKYFLITMEQLIYALYFHCMSVRMQKYKHWSHTYIKWDFSQQYESDH